MRLLMLNNEFPPLGGGTGTVTRELLKRLANHPHIEIDLITSSVGNDSFEDSISGNIRVYGVPVNNKDLHHSSNRELCIYSLRSLPAALKRQKQHPYDLCLAWSAVPAGAVALILHRLKRIPYIVRVSGPDIPGFEERYAALYPVLKPLIRRIWRESKVVIAKCTREAELIRSLDPRTRITLIANGVDLQAFCPRPGPFLGEPLRLLCVARLIERKGQRHLFQAVSVLRQSGLSVRLVLVGAGDSLPIYLRKVRDLGIEGNVEFAGYVPRERIREEYARADVFVLPSYNEGMSVATLEAMASGLPLLITRSGGAEVLVEEGVNGFTFDWGDVGALADLVRRMTGDREMLGRMGTASRRIAERYSWDTVTENYLLLFQEGLRRRAPAASAASDQAAPSGTPRSC